MNWPKDGDELMYWGMGTFLLIIFGCVAACAVRYTIYFVFS